jgi:hypothetical protein
MQAGLLQLMALLTNNNDEEDDSDSETSSNHPRNPAAEPTLSQAERDNLYASITPQERAEWTENDAYEEMLEQEDRQQIAEMMGFGGEEEAMEMLRSDDEDELAISEHRRGFYAPSLDDDEDEEEDEWEDEGME